MRPGNVFSGAAFRVAAISLLVFCAVMVVTGAAIIEIVRVSMTNDLRAQIAGEVILFSGIYHNEGEAALEAAVERLGRAEVPGQTVAGMFGKGGEHLAGGLSLAPDFIGWGTVTRSRTARAGRYHVEAVTIGGRKLVVGRSLEQVEAMRARLMKALLVAGLVVTFVIMVIGYIVSSNVFRRMQRMALVLGEVSRGDDKIRLEVGRGDSQFDQIARMMNAHLDRLSALMRATRNSIIAIAHDLRTPLNRASLRVQEVSGRVEQGSEAEAALAEVGEEIRSISEVFDTILRIARISGSDDRSDFEPLSATALAREMAETFQPVLEEGGMRLALEAKGEAMIRGDRRMLTQMLANLIENVSHHCPEGTEVTLAIHEDRESVQMILADNGPGIPEDRRKAALDPFQQFAGLKDSQGVGLGLALVRAIADRHHAALTLSDNAPGLKVTVSFPKS